MIKDDDIPEPPRRLASVDAYRGFVMFLMMAEVLHLASVAKAHPESPIWKFLAHHQEHVAWAGCTLHDLIQPSFSFLVGVALPFSIASRMARGQSALKMSLHALWRGGLLIFLGVFLRSVGKPVTNFTFEDTLSQIGLGYPILFVLGLRPTRDQWIAFGAILVGYWLAFALYAPGSGFDYTNVGVPNNFPELSKGFRAHWNKNGNLAWAFDVWFLNLFHRANPFTFNGGGYATLSFIPTLGTMILGLIAGVVLRSERTDWGKVAWLLLAGVAGLASGWVLGALGICPVVKRIWTPSWVLFSGGCCLLLLAAWYICVDLIGPKVLAFPLIVIGMNSIAAYVLSHLIEGFIVGGFKTHGWVVVEPLRNLLKNHLELDLTNIVSGYEPLIQGGLVLLVLWLILFWMERRRLFLRI